MCELSNEKVHRGKSNNILTSKDYSKSIVSHVFAVRRNEHKRLSVRHAFMEESHFNKDGTRISWIILMKRTDILHRLVV